MADDIAEAGGAAPQNAEPGAPEDMSRRLFLERLRRNTLFVAPVVAALLLTPAPALGY